MDNFYTYLTKKRKMQTSSADLYQKAVDDFEKWLVTQSLQANQTGIKDLLNYLAHLQQEQRKETAQRNVLTSLRHYFNYLLENEEINFNPASRLFVKPSIRTVAQAPLSMAQLYELYERYEVDNAKDLEHKVIIGLLVYQGMATAEIAYLRVKDLQLREGKITIPSLRRSNGRTLKLEGNQVSFLQRYLQEFTPQEYLFPSIRKILKNGRLSSNYFFGLNKKLRNLIPMVINAPHIRQSVIAHWTKQYDIRMVQYMSGHKWISSTQRYDLVSLETLQAEIDLLHPLNDV